MEQDIKKTIQVKYGAAARTVSGATGMTASCGATACCSKSQSTDNISEGLYDAPQIEALPPAAVLASLGCGNPTALAELHPGETVLDLGSGGGIDVLLSARRVGPTGKVYGLDMTDEMLELARNNQRQAGIENVEFLKGDIEAIPLPDNLVDVIISNCVINLATDKDKVFREAHRVLKPGGRFAVSDIVFQGDAEKIPQELRDMADAWAGCVSGALEEQDYLSRLRAAGFSGASLEVTRIYTDTSEAEYCDIDLPQGVRLVSGFVRAAKPSAAKNAAVPSIHQVSPPEGGDQEPSSRRSKTIWPR